jgi:hypothetical protein
MQTEFTCRSFLPLGESADAGIHGGSAAMNAVLTASSTLSSRLWRLNTYEPH